MVTTPTNTNINISPDTTSKIRTCILHAHFHNMADPGTYQTELNNLLKMNKLPKINAPSKAPSNLILNTNLTASETPQGRHL